MKKLKTNKQTGKSYTQSKLKIRVCLSLEAQEAEPEVQGVRFFPEAVTEHRRGDQGAPKREGRGTRVRHEISTMMDESKKKK